MNYFKFCQMTLISILALSAIGINSATAGSISASQDLAAKPKLGLDIGLLPISFKESLSNTIENRIALKQGSTTQGKQPVEIGVTARVGTLGIGIDVAKSITPQFDARLGFNFGSVNSSRTESGIDYDANLNLSSIQLFGDYHPFGGGFRITGGLLSQNNKFSVTSKPNGGSYTIDGTQFSAAQVGSLTGEYKFGNSIAPYLGIGIGQPANAGFGFNADLGVLFTGSPKVTLNATNPTFNNNPITRNQIDNQVRQTENDLKGFNVYPVLSIGLSYGF